MKHFQEFSHLHGAEYLAVKKLSIHREIIAMLAECHRKTLTRRGIRSNFESFENLSASFAEAALQRAWRKTSTGLEKERVALNCCTPTCSLEKIVGNWLWDYSVGNIDVGIGILPENKLKQRSPIRAGKEKPIRSFNEVIRAIRRLGRNVPHVPFLLIAIPLQH